MQAIAKHSFQAKNARGEQVELTVAIGQPAKDTDKGCWACPISLQGVNVGLPKAVYAEDSFQALCLGIGMLATGIQLVQEQGWKVLDAQEELDVRSWFGWDLYRKALQ